MGAYGNTEMVYTWTLKETDTETYSVSVSGGEITTKLSASDPKFYEESDYTVTWLTRADWEGTFPKESAKVVLTQSLEQELQNNHYEPSKINMTRCPMPTTEADNGLRLYDMMGKSYDDPNWERLLDQLNFEQYENDPYIRTLMREACHRGLYALANSAAMNGIGPNREISKNIFWPVKLSFALEIIFWGLTAFCAVRWHRRRKAWKVKRQSADTSD